MFSANKVLSLYTGLGGFELGIFCAGLEALFYPTHFVEMDEYCQSVLTKWFPTIPITPLIQDFKPLTDYDIVTAGFPCQPHSLAGLRKGTNDNRDLWQQTINVIKQVKPKAFILENVPGLRHTHQGDFFKRVLRDIANAGYDAEWRHTTVSAVGGIHKRKRIFIIAYPIGFRQSRQSNTSKRGTDNSPTTADTTAASTWLQVKSSFCGVDDGFSSRMDWLLTQDDKEFAIERAADNDDKPLRKQQIKALGNSVCPQQSAQIWLRLKDILYDESTDN